MGIISLDKLDHLYWLGRYTERVYTTLRKFYKIYDSMIEAPEGAYRTYCERLNIPDVYGSNEAFVKKMAIQEPVNYRLVCNGEHLIVGVVEDFVIDNLSRQIQPLLIEYNSTSYNTLVKIKEGSMSVAIQKIKELWKKISGDEEGLKFRTMAGMYEDLHQEEQRVLQMVVLFSWISLFLTALGLFGLAWYSVESRMKEIGLRKINGATQRQVVGLLCIRFIKWIAIALAIGLPMALYLIEQWRMQYAFRPQLTVWIFIAAAFIVLAVGILTVIWQSWKAARVNPAKIIKTD